MAVLTHFLDQVCGLNKAGILKVKLQLQYFLMVPLTYFVVLTFESVVEILRCDHLNETSPAVLSHGSLYFVCISAFEFLDLI